VRVGLAVDGLAYPRTRAHVHVGGILGGLGTGHLACAWRPVPCSLRQVYSLETTGRLEKLRL
jgi:hypothetical protein